MAKRPPKYTERDLKCAKWIYQLVLKLYNKSKEPNWHIWANDIRLMREREKRSYEEISELFRWANQHAFWKMNILSPAKLRQQWDRLAIQMQQDPMRKKPEPKKPKQAYRPPTEAKPINAVEAPPEYYEFIKKLTGGFDPKEEYQKETREKLAEEEKVKPKPRKYQILHGQNRTCAACHKPASPPILHQQIFFCISCFRDE